LQRCRRCHDFTLAASLRSNFTIIYNTTLPFSRMLPSPCPCPCPCPSGDLRLEKSEELHSVGYSNLLQKMLPRGARRFLVLGAPRTPHVPRRPCDAQKRQPSGWVDRGW
jgi:hypothetical protein